MRNIFEVYAKVVDANGNYNTLTGYPKIFDSNNYDGDVDKAKKRAIGEFHDTIGGLCKRDDRQIQTVILWTADGFVIDKWTDGHFVEPEQTEEPTE